MIGYVTYSSIYIIPPVDLIYYNVQFYLKSYTKVQKKSIFHKKIALLQFLT